MELKKPIDRDAREIAYLGIREDVMAWSGHRVPVQVLGYTREVALPFGDFPHGFRILILEDYIERNPYTVELREGVLCVRQEDVYLAFPLYIRESIDDFLTKAKAELHCRLVPEAGFRSANVEEVLKNSYIGHMKGFLLGTLLSMGLE